MHDLRVAAEISDHILMMQKRQMLEYGAVDEVFGNLKRSRTNN
ncbi:hypothetical protein [Rhizobium oryziradicis]|nr:hypothetical protein [Rhizobium oryziradicis]